MAVAVLEEHVPSAMAVPWRSESPHVANGMPKFWQLIPSFDFASVAADSMTYFNRKVPAVLSAASRLTVARSSSKIPSKGSFLSLSPLLAKKARVPVRSRECGKCITYVKVAQKGTA
jgi:hypothetical protein